MNMREGIEIEREARPISIYSLELLFSLTMQFRWKCIALKALIFVH